MSSQQTTITEQTPITDRVRNDISTLLNALNVLSLQDLDQSADESKTDNPREVYERNMEQLCIAYTSINRQMQNTIGDWNYFTHFSNTLSPAVYLHHHHGNTYFRIKMKNGQNYTIEQDPKDSKSILLKKCY